MGFLGAFGTEFHPCIPGSPGLLGQGGFTYHGAGRSHADGCIAQILAQSHGIKALN